MPRVRGLVVSLLVLSVGPPAAAAPVVRATGEVEVAAGHDDNMLLATAPDAPTSLARLGGWFGQVAPALTLGLAGAGFRLEASYAGDYRVADEVGQLYFQQGELTASLPALGPVRLLLAASAGSFHAGRFPEDQFLFVGGALGLRVGLADSLRLAAGYRVQGRKLGDASRSTDVLHAGDVRLVYLPTAAVELGPRVSLLVVQPRAADSLRFSRWRAGVDGGVELGPLTTTAGAWLGALEMGAQFERHVGGDLELRWPLTRSLAVFAAVELAVPISAGASQDYARRLFAVGLGGSLSVVRAAPAPRPEVDLRPLVQAGRVRLRLKAAPGADVWVVGSWNDWQPPGQALVPTAEGGVFEVWLDLPPGSHRYHFLVGGQTRRPPDAPRYAPDGFGGDDGVLDVDAAPPSP